MKNSFGNNISLCIFGESHGEMIGAVLDGIPAGFPVDEEKIARDMDKRRARGNISTARKEADAVRIVSGLFQGRTTGTAITLLIENTNTRSQDYAQIQYRLRPGHADFTAFEKYHGFQDYRGGGHFSGRLTAAAVAAGSICRQVLETRGIHIASHIEMLHDICDLPFSQDPAVLQAQMAQADEKEFAVLDAAAEEEMQACILAAAASKDSVGGILESAITGLPAGLGEPWFDSVESVLSHLLFSIPAVKGVSFGKGFGFASLYGSQANDPFMYEETIKTATNNNAGINGGITNGMPVIVHTAIKPTPSIYQKQRSVDYQSKEEVVLEIKGRHDPCILHRARVVVDCLLAFGILDLYMAYAAAEGMVNGS